MSTNVVRTEHGWWVEKGGALTPIDTTAATTADLLADRAAVEEAAARPAADGPRVGDVTALSPVTAPCRVVAQMVNYRSHATDSGIDPDTVPPAFFRKSSGSISGPTDDIVCPPHIGFLDYEVELGLVVGKRLEVDPEGGCALSVSDLAAHVAGIVVTNDVSARQVQLTRTQFYESKSYPTFTPVGPYLTLLTPKETALLGRLRLRLSVNDEERQHHTTSDMIVDPARALGLLSRFQVLDPGDLVLTGTPGGTALKAPPRPVEMIGALLPPALKWKAFFRRQAANPRYLQDGDVVTTRIEYVDGGLDLGTQRNVVRKSTPGVPA